MVKWFGFPQREVEFVECKVDVGHGFRLVGFVHHQPNQQVLRLFQQCAQFARAAHAGEVAVKAGEVVVGHFGKIFSCLSFPLQK